MIAACSASFEIPSLTGGTGVLLGQRDFYFEKSGSILTSTTTPGEFALCVGPKVVVTVNTNNNSKLCLVEIEQFTSDDTEDVIRCHVLLEAVFEGYHRRNGSKRIKRYKFKKQPLRKEILYEQTDFAELCRRQLKSNEYRLAEFKNGELQCVDLTEMSVPPVPSLPMKKTDFVFDPDQDTESNSGAHRAPKPQPKPSAESFDSLMVFPGELDQESPLTSPAPGAPITGGTGTGSQLEVDPIVEEQAKLLQHYSKRKNQEHL